MSKRKIEMHHYRQALLRMCGKGILTATLHAAVSWDGVRRPACAGGQRTRLARGEPGRT